MIANIVLTAVEWLAAAAFIVAGSLAVLSAEPGLLVVAGFAGFIAVCTRATSMLRRTGEAHDRIRRHLG